MLLDKSENFLTCGHLAQPQILCLECSIDPLAKDVTFIWNLQIPGQQSSLAYLEDLLCVVHAVNPDVVLQRGAVGVREEHQPETLGGPHVQRLPHQREGAQLLGEKAAHLGFKLAVIGLRHQLFPHQQDILEEARQGTNEV